MKKTVLFISPQINNCWTKVFLNMKLTAFFILITALQVSAKTYSQERVTVNFENTRLSKALKEVEMKSGFHFVYSNLVLTDKSRITFQAKDIQVEDLLVILLEYTGLSFSVMENKLIVLVQKNEEIQDVVVKGKVIDASTGKPLAGASIQIKGSNAGTTTDANGNYSINVPEKTTLLFSSVGYDNVEMPVNGRKVINISLEVSATGLNAVVVVGYGTQKAKDITGSIVRITTDKTSSLPNYNLLQSIQGRVAGIDIGTPVRTGASPSIQIRGLNSITASNSPLIVLDAVIYKGDINSINPSDIATIDILKDASAAAIYGSRAANGVLLITTKSGTSDEPQLHFGSYIGIQNPVKLVRPLDGPQYLQKVLDYRESVGLDANPDNIDLYLTQVEAENRDKGKTTNWLDQVIKTGVTHNYQLDVSGKSKNTNYYISGAYFKQKGIVVNDNWRRITLNTNITNHITKWLNVSLRSMFNTQGSDGLPANMFDAFSASPYGNVHDSSGPGRYAFFPVGDPLGTNPFLPTLIQNKENNTAFWGVLSTNLEVPFIPGLKWTMNFSNNLNIASVNKFMDNATSTDGATNNGIGTKNETKTMDWQFDNILNYRKNFGGNHSLFLTFLYSQEGAKVESSGMKGTNFFNQILGYNAMELAQTQTISSDNESDRGVSYMARANYSYKGKYAMTFTARRDGYSGFSENHKYATFPSVALAWTATNEKFLNNISWLSYLKLRVSYGDNGNQSVGRYRSLATLSSNNYLFGQQSISSLFASSMGNKQLTWETTSSQNIGIDFQVLDQRLSGSLDIYSSKTNNLLLNKNMPETSGFRSILTNVGKINNHGVELSLSSTNLKQNDWGWSSGLTFSLNRNRIEQLAEQGDDIRAGWFIGQPLGSFYGYKIDGIYQLNDFSIPSGFKPGDYRIVDINHSGGINADDRIILGNSLPNYSFSISNTINFKNISLYLLINSIQGGGEYYLGNAMATVNPNNPYSTYTERFNFQDVPYWTPDRPSNKYPRINYIKTFPTSYLESRSFIRIQDISLSYTFNKTFLDKSRLKNLRLYVSGKNLYTLTKWDGYDPQNATGVGDFPLMRYFTAGLDISF